MVVTYLETERWNLLIYSELDLFTVKPTQTSIEDVSVAVYRTKYQSTLIYPEAAASISTQATFSYTCVQKSYGQPVPISKTMAHSCHSTSYFTACSHRWTFCSTPRWFPTPQTPICTGKCWKRCCLTEAMQKRRNCRARCTTKTRPCGLNFNGSNPHSAGWR